MGKNVTISTLPNIGQNYLPKINTSNIFANSLVYDDGSSVLINTTTASAFKLDVNGSIRATSGTLTGALIGTTASFTSNSGNFTLGNQADTAIYAHFGSKSASGGQAVAMKLAGTLTATANFDNLFGLWVDYTDNAAGYTGVVRYGIYQNDSGKRNYFGGPTTFNSVVTVSDTATATAFIPTGTSIPSRGMYTSASNVLDFSAGTTNLLSLNYNTGLSTFNTGVKGSYFRIVNVSTAEFGINTENNQGYIGTTTSHGFNIMTNNTPRLTISSTGAATFSSSVYATNYIINEASANRGGLYPYNRVLGSGTDYSVGIFSEGEIFMAPGGGTTKRLVITSGGNVGIGLTNPLSPLHAQLTDAGVGTKTIVQTIERSGASPSGTPREVGLVFKDGNNPTLVGGIAGVRFNSGGNYYGGLKFYVQSSNASPATTFSNLTAALTIDYASAATFAGSVSMGGDLTFTPNDSVIGFSSGAGRFFTGGAERMRITSGGDVLVGRTDAAAGNLGAKISSTGFIEAVVNNDVCFSANRKNATGVLMLFQYQNSTKGTISTDGTNTAYNTSSDYRLKEDLKIINGLEKLSKIKVYDFKWKDSNLRMDGVLAHELQEVLPYAVQGKKDAIDKDGNIYPQGVDYSKIVPVLIKSMQELKAEIDTLKK